MSVSQSQQQDESLSTPIAIEVKIDYSQKIQHRASRTLLIINITFTFIFIKEETMRVAYSQLHNKAYAKISHRQASKEKFRRRMNWRDFMKRKHFPDKRWWIKNVEGWNKCKSTSCWWDQVAWEVSTTSDVRDCSWWWKFKLLWRASCGKPLVSLQLAVSLRI